MFGFSLLPLLPRLLGFGSVLSLLGHVLVFLHPLAVFCKEECHQLDHVLDGVTITIDATPDLPSGFWIIQLENLNSMFRFQLSFPVTY